MTECVPLPPEGTPITPARIIRNTNSQAGLATFVQAHHDHEEDTDR